MRVEMENVIERSKDFVKIREKSEKKASRRN